MLTVAISYVGRQLLHPLNVNLPAVPPQAAIESIESRDNHQAIGLERERGWIASACLGDPASVMLRMTPSA